MSGPPSSSPFSARVAAILITVAAISFGAVLVMAGWAPELRERNRAGDHPYSTSALGYNGFVRLLEDAGYPVKVSRLESDLESRGRGLMIVTLPAYGNFSVLDDRVFQPATLVVLPKWTGRTDPVNAARQADTRFIEARDLNDQLSVAYPDAEILRVRVPDSIETPFGTAPIRPDVRLQLIRDASLEPIIAVGDGALLAYDPARSLYILSDPDVFHTFGLAQRENARFAVQMVDFLRYDSNEPILLDATLHGFERSENLLKMMFSVPYIGVTLVALAAALLLGWAVTVRFGPPLAEARAIALGKQALADNSAGLVVMAVTWQPQARANCSARWPNPPMPITATWAVGDTASSISGANTVMPPQNSGPARAGSRLSGMGISQSCWAFTWLAKPPLRPTTLASRSAQRF